MNSNINPLRLVIKAACLFVVINVLYALIQPPGATVSGYNLIFPGRTRLPFGVSGDPYSVTVEDVDIMFASHSISAAKNPDEYRVVFLGDSSLWGEDLGAYEVISEQWNSLDVRCGDLVVKAYNLGYPHPSVLKDLVILHKAMEYKPDLVIWFVTLNTLMSQRVNPFLVANRQRAGELVEMYDITFQQSKQFDSESSFYDRTLIGQRSTLARWFKLQMLGIIWAATGQDTNTLAVGQPPDLTIDDDPRYRGMEPPRDIRNLLLFDALAAGHVVAAPVPMLIVNEPIFVVDPQIAPVRYNPVYPRWVYDQYRQHIAVQAQNAGWNYIDLWNAVPPDEFVDARFHLSVAGERLLVQQIRPAVQSIACAANP